MSGRNLYEVQQYWLRRRLAARVIQRAPQSTPNKPHRLPRLDIEILKNNINKSIMTDHQRTQVGVTPRELYTKSNPGLLGNDTTDPRSWYHSTTKSKLYSSFWTQYNQKVHNSGNKQIAVMTLPTLKTKRPRGLKKLGITKSKVPMSLSRPLRNSYKLSHSNESLFSTNSAYSHALEVDTSEDEMVINVIDDDGIRADELSLQSRENSTLRFPKINDYTEDSGDNQIQNQDGSTFNDIQKLPNILEYSEISEHNVSKKTDVRDPRLEALFSQLQSKSRHQSDVRHLLTAEARRRHHDKHNTKLLSQALPDIVEKRVLLEKYKSLRLKQSQLTETFDKNAYRLKLKSEVKLNLQERKPTRSQSRPQTEVIDSKSSLIGKTIKRLQTSTAGTGQRMNHRRDLAVDAHSCSPTKKLIDIPKEEESPTTKEGRFVYKRKVTPHSNESINKTYTKAKIVTLLMREENYKRERTRTDISLTVPHSVKMDETALLENEKSKNDILEVSPVKQVRFSESSQISESGHSIKSSAVRSDTGKPKSVLKKFQRLQPFGESDRASQLGSVIDEAAVVKNPLVKLDLRSAPSNDQLIPNGNNQNGDINAGMQTMDDAIEELSRKDLSTADDFKPIDENDNIVMKDEIDASAQESHEINGSAQLT